MRPRRPFERILADSLATQDGCLLWSGSKDRDGYGTFSGRKAHRVAYELSVGPIPEGMVLDHTCFQRDCVNVAHLRPLTNLANVRNTSRRPGVVPDEQCINGHEWTPENTYIRPSGHRDCRVCIRERARRYKARHGRGSA